MIEVFKSKIDTNLLSEGEKDELMTQLELRLNKVNDILKGEDSSQEKRL